MNRGDRREAIFLDDVDHRRFLETLEEGCIKADWQVHAYCLMHNHFHLVLETPTGNLVAGMRWFLSTYTARFNRRHKLFGHLFSGRYKALIVDGSGNSYLRTVCNYVHLNPARAGVLKPEQRLSEFLWSSWPEYLKEPKVRPNWLRVDRYLGEMGIPQDSVVGREELERRVEERRAAEEDDEFKPIQRGWCLGDETFRKELLARAEGSVGEHHLPETRRETTEDKARRIIAEELERLGWTEKDLAARPKGDREKIRIAERLRKETTMTLKRIADQLKTGTGAHTANRLRDANLPSPDEQNEFELV